MTISTIEKKTIMAGSAGILLAALYKNKEGFTISTDIDAKFKAAKSKLEEMDISSIETELERLKTGILEADLANEKAEDIIAALELFETQANAFDTSITDMIGTADTDGIKQEAETLYMEAKRSLISEVGKMNETEVTAYTTQLGDIKAEYDAKLEDINTFIAHNSNQ